MRIENAAEWAWRRWRMILCLSGFAGGCVAAWFAIDRLAAWAMAS